MNYPLLPRERILKPLLVVFKINDSSLPSGLSVAGSFSAERAGKRVRKLSLKDLQQLKGTDLKSTRVFANNSGRPTFEEPGVESSDNLRKSKAIRKKAQLLLEKQGSRIRSLLILKQNVNKLSRQESTSAIDAGTKVAEGIGGISSLHRSASDIKRMREQADQALLSNDADGEKAHEELVRNSIKFDSKRSEKLTASIGLPRSQKYAIWKDRIVVKVMWDRGKKGREEGPNLASGGQSS